MTTNKRKIILFVVLAAAILALTAYLTKDWWAPVPDNTDYKTNDYSFIYPRIYDAQEYASGVVSIGERTDDSFNPLVEVVRYKNDPDVLTPASFDAFIRRQAMNLCGADGPIESITCTNGSSTPYVTANAHHPGTVLTLSLVRKNLETGTSTTMSYGPIYVFNLTDEPSADDPLRYEAIFVYPSLPAFVAGTDSPELLQQVIDSFVIPNGISAVGQ